MTPAQFVVRAVVALLGLVVVYALGFFNGHEHGTDVTERAAARREEQASSAHGRAYRQLDTRYRAAEESLRAGNDAAEESLLKALNDEKAQHDRLVAGLRARAIRLSVPVIDRTAGAACGAAPPGDPAPAAGDRHETRAELAPEAAEDLVAIAADGNAAILQANACIDRYEDLRGLLNSLRRKRTDAEAQ